MSPALIPLTGASRIYRVIVTSICFLGNGKLSNMVVRIFIGNKDVAKVEPNNVWASLYSLGNTEVSKKNNIVHLYPHLFSQKLKSIVYETENRPSIRLHQST